MDDDDVEVVEEAVASPLVSVSVSVLRVDFTELLLSKDSNTSVILSPVWIFESSIFTIVSPVYSVKVTIASSDPEACLRLISSMLPMAYSE